MSPDSPVSHASEAPADDKRVQWVVTFGIGGVFAVYMWPKLDGISRCVLVISAVFAAMSINNGTWLTDSRQLRREARDNRRQAFGQLKRKFI